MCVAASPIRVSQSYHSRYRILPITTQRSLQVLHEPPSGILPSSTIAGWLIIPLPRVVWDIMGYESDILPSYPDLRN